MTANEDILLKLTPEERAAMKKTLWEETKANTLACRACPLAETRTKVVFGDGDPDTKLLFIGEGPGADEDAQGLPFVGRAGQLLTQILTAAEISRKDVYITNIVKCRPPENRVPTPAETVICDKHLQTQIMLINPALMVLLGNTPARWILQTSEGITKLRGRWFEWHGIAVMPMFHPSYLLRNASSKEGSPKHLTWLDIQEVKRQWDAVKATGSISGIKFG
ncbi:uracil-DNA glycosylase [Cloacibacillus sp.]|uniref:uracil-DNA glycosylase n=1 Tax=Cloacibacillus sp. TaxID=2049023 RepID=UPI0025BA6C2E|nr:uracil-DNA glycosylase [Cloacibacillus sp.]MCC8058922.1 uracil-DNA glycosylase [Cloacibacillus sp.]MCC8178031.1 uracil-DNA glycosylase [Cloacibacillus sp.]